MVCFFQDIGLCVGRFYRICVYLKMYVISKYMRSSFTIGHIRKKFNDVSIFNSVALKQRYCLTVDKKSLGHSLLAEDVCQQWAERLEECGIPVPEARSSAELIIANVVGKKMFNRLAPGLMLTKIQLEEIAKMMERRKLREPVQHVIGEWDFVDMTLLMAPSVFIPRPETEELANLVHLHMTEKTNQNGKLHFLEIGCGSGAISVYLLYHCPKFSGIAVDINPEACWLTRNNAEMHNVLNRLQVKNLDINKQGNELRRDAFDLIVSNPPYILTSDIKDLDPEIRCYEDHRALDGGSDGLSLVKTILHKAAALLKPNRELWLEVGLGHPEEIQEYVESHNLHLQYVQTHLDYTNRGRFCQLKCIK